MTTTRYTTIDDVSTALATEALNHESNSAYFGALADVAIAAGEINTSTLVEILAANITVTTADRWEAPEGITETCIHALVTHIWGHHPTIEELAHRLDIDADDITEIVTGSSEDTDKWFDGDTLTTTGIADLLDAYTVLA